jgi:thioredoxin 1
MEDKLNIKQILYVVVIFLLIFIASYLLTQRGIKRGHICPAPAIKQGTKQVVPLPQKAATNHPKVTFIELGSVGCTPCDMMRPILDEIEKEYEGQVLVRFHNVNSLLGRPYAQQYGIRAIPTQVFLDKDGNEYFRHIGFFPKDEIVKILQLRGVK